MTRRKNPYANWTPNSQGGSDDFQDMTLQRGSIITPSWNKGYITVRVMPGVRQDDPTVPDTFRMEGSVDFGYWLETIFHVRNMKGTNNRTNKEQFYSFIATDSLYDGSPADSPYQQVCSAIKKVTSAPKSGAPSFWRTSREGKAGKGADWPDIALKYVMPVRVLHSGDRDWQEDTSLKSLYILLLSKSLGEAITRDLQRNLANAQTPEQVIDLTNPHGGAFLTIWSSNVEDPRATKQYTLLEGTTTRMGENGTAFNGYNYSIDSLYPCADKWKGRSPVLTEDQLLQYSQIAGTWLEVLKCMSYDEQAKLLAANMPSDLIQYAFSGIPEWLPMGDTMAPQALTQGASPSYSAPVPQATYPAPSVAPYSSGPVQQVYVAPVPTVAPQQGPTSILQAPQVSESMVLEWIRQHPEKLSVAAAAPVQVPGPQSVPQRTVPPVSPFDTNEFPPITSGVAPFVEFTEEDDKPF